MNVTERFIAYTAYESTSNEDSETCPSTPSQIALAKRLADDLKEIGVSKVFLDENGYLTAVLPASSGRENDSAIGFIAHMDTSPDVSGKDVKAQIIKYEGGDIDLGKAVTRLADYPYLADYIGEQLIVTDGSTLLGSDDKAGISEIFSSLEFLIKHPEISHRQIAVCITPDEEIGRGADLFPLERFEAKEAYTIDGGFLGEIEYENFNAASCNLTVNGVNIHPGSAKNKMKNAVLLANEFISRMPSAETPAHTEGYEGFYHITDIKGDETLCKMHMIIRDHDLEKFENRKVFVKQLCDYLNSVYGDNTFVCEIKDSYFNMKEKILPFMHLIDNAQKAFCAVGVEPLIVPIRGGTDGARLSYMGLPCPNLSTGAANMHSIHEFVPVKSLEKMVETIVELSK